MFFPFYFHFFRWSFSRCPSPSYLQYESCCAGTSKYCIPNSTFCSQEYHCRCLANQSPDRVRCKIQYSAVLRLARQIGTHHMPWHYPHPEQTPTQFSHIRAGKLRGTRLASVLHNLWLVAGNPRSDRQGNAHSGRQGTKNSLKGT